MIVNVPSVPDTSMPMTVGVLKEFKHNYYGLLLGECRSREAQEQESRLKDKLRLIRRAWREVQGYTIRHCFKSFLQCLRKFAPSTTTSRIFYIMEKPSFSGIFWPDKLQDNDGHESRLLQAVKDAYPGAQDTVLRYYLNQDGDTGPSSLLRAKIREMQDHQDFMNCFGSLVFNQVSIHQAKRPRNPVRIQKQLDIIAIMKRTVDNSGKLM
ncbi:hypothetical protein BGZ65_010082, partial [Modicella reniformis]